MGMNLDMTFIQLRRSGILIESEYEIQLKLRRSGILIENGQSTFAIASADELDVKHAMPATTPDDKISRERQGPQRHPLSAGASAQTDFISSISQQQRRTKIYRHSGGKDTVEDPHAAIKSQLVVSPEYEY